MGNTKLISIRIPNGVLLAVDDIAKKERRSRAKIIIHALEFSIARLEVVEHHLGIGGRQTQQAAVVDKLSRSSPTLKVSNPSSPTKACPDCGALIGHQKWCKAK